VQIVWTFEDKNKLNPFLEVLRDNNISYELLLKGKQIVSDEGLILAVDESDYKKAKKILLDYRKRISNRHNQ
jgi:hypothetical protein